MECTKKYSVDFCGECKEFPCTQTRALFEDEVYQKWLRGSQEIHALGIEQYWNNHSKESHYYALLLGLGASALCFVTWNTAVKLLVAVQTSVYIYMVPVITVIISILVLRETLTWMSVLGMTLSLA